jgi:3',5'-cyclic AMP phosphodiesterase CpdA
MKLIVLSDLHLMAAEDHACDLATHARLEAAIDRINAAYDDADLVVVAGDLVDRGRHLELYEALQAALARLKPRYALTIGNHDLRANFQAVFAPAQCDAAGFAQSAHEIGGFRVLVLDSASEAPPPKGYGGLRTPVGELCAQRLDWLDQQLAMAKDQPVIVILHHPPLQLQLTLDFMGLGAPEALIDRLVAHGDVRHVLSGHIHLTTTAFHRGIPFTTIAGGFSTGVEDFGRAANKRRRDGPAQMAVVLADPDQVTVHFDNYVDAHPVI